MSLTLQSLKIEGLSKYPGVFELLWVMDMNAYAPENYYRVLFRNDRGMYKVEHLYPEVLSYHSKDSYYRNGRKVKEPSLQGESKEILLLSSDVKAIKKISEAIDKSEFTHGFSGNDFTDEIGRQYCVEVENRADRFIFPCWTIGVAFYFTSTVMRKRIFDSKLEGMFERFANGDTPAIKLKSGTNNSDAPHLIRFITNGNANKQWFAIKNNLLVEKKRIKGWALPLKIDFPVKDPLEITVRGRKVKYGKEEIFLVCEIVEIWGGFNFKSYKIIRESRSGKEVEIKKWITKILPRNRGIMSGGKRKPSSLNAPVAIDDHVGEVNKDIEGMLTITEYEDKKGDHEEVLYEHEKEATSVSFAEPAANGDQNLSHGKTRRCEEKRNRDIKRIKRLSRIYC